MVNAINSRKTIVLSNSLRRNLLRLYGGLCSLRIVFVSVRVET